MRRYTHLYELGFEVNSANKAEAVTGAEICAALRQRRAELTADGEEAFVEAVGCPAYTEDCLD